MSASRFIVGFNRDRDSYQLPLALAERHALAGLVTDYYVGASAFRVRRLAHRKSDGIPPDLVKVSNRAFLLQAVGRATGVFPASSRHFEAVDRSIAKKVASVLSEQPSSGLFLYSGYAGELYRDVDVFAKWVFQFHPTPGHVRTALLQDDLSGLELEWQEPEEHRSRTDLIHDLELEFSDHFVCASAFTASGLAREGVSADRLSVAPYGCGTPGSKSQIQEHPRGSSFSGPSFLFVGQGVRRKGLHLLLEAWRRLGLQNAHLRIIASRIDPVLARMASSMSTVALTGSVPPAALREAMHSADTLVLPSLVEGFGLVIGEALAANMRVIATDHTGLPDYGDLGKAGRVIQAGNLSALVGALRDFADSYDAERTYAVAVHEVAQRNSWDEFRRKAVNELPGITA